MATYQDIKKQIAQLEKRAEEVRKSELANVILDIKRKIAEYDLTAADLGLSVQGRRSTTNRKPREKVPPKYMNPATGITWNGMGKAPLWIAAAIKTGRRDEFLIERIAGKRKSSGVKSVKPKKAPSKKAIAGNKPALRKAVPGRKSAAGKPKRTPIKAKSTKVRETRVTDVQSAGKS